MDVINIVESIKLKIDEIEKERNKLEQLSIKKAEEESNYDRVLAVTIIKLKNGVSIKIDEEEIDSPPATIIEKIAKGNVWKERFEVEKATGLYKACISNIGALESQLNGYQSINRHLSEM